MKIQADLHTHTIASTHAYSTISENCQWAAQYGLKAIAMTDHGMAMPDSPHEWHFYNMRVLPRQICEVTVLKGVEANIVNINGELDIPEWMLKSMDWVVASMHEEAIKQDTVENITNAYLKLCENPYVDVIGHCTNVNFMFDYEKCVQAFKKYEKLVEINESAIINKPGTRENCIRLLKFCKKYEVPVVLDSDSHFCQNIGQTPNAIEVVKEVDFPEELIVNLDWEKVKAHILKKHNNLSL